LYLSVSGSSLDADDAGRKVDRQRVISKQAGADENIIAIHEGRFGGNGFAVERQPDDV